MIFTFCSFENIIFSLYIFPCWMHFSGNRLENFSSRDIFHFPESLKFFHHHMKEVYKASVLIRSFKDAGKFSRTIRTFLSFQWKKDTFEVNIPTTNLRRKREKMLCMWQQHKFLSSYANRRESVTEKVGNFQMLNWVWIYLSSKADRILHRLWD